MKFTNVTFMQDVGPFRIGEWRNSVTVNYYDGRVWSDGRMVQLPVGMLTNDNIELFSAESVVCLP